MSANRVICCIAASMFWISCVSTQSKMNEYYQSDITEQSRLYSELLTTYHNIVPPTEDGPIEVEIKLSMYYFDFPNEAKQQACVHALSHRKWTDPRLRWEPSDFNNTDNVLIPINKIWTPDIALYRGATATSTAEAHAIVTHDGTVSYVPSFQFNFICDMDLRNFPYDTQVCALKMGSWHYHEKTLNLTMSAEEPALMDAIPLPDFDLIDIEQKRNLKKYPCCVENYIDVTYSFVLKRKSSAYSAKLVLPSVLAGFLILGTFLVPNSSCERLTVCVVLFLCLVHLLTYLHDIIPTSGDTILGQFLAFALFIDFLAIILAVISFNLHRRGFIQQTVMESNADGERDLKIQSAKSKKTSYLQYFDIICFVIFGVVYIIGFPVILSQRN